MSTSPTTSTSADDQELRLALHESGNHVHGAWWPRSRVLAVEGAALVDHFPASEGRINRLLFSRPDWDDATAGGKGLRRIAARRGPVKVGSFPSDDTHLMVLAMASGQRLRLQVIPSDLDPAEGERRLRSITEHGVPDGVDDAQARWDDESPEH